MDFSFMKNWMNVYGRLRFFLSTGGLDVCFVATDVHAGAQQAAWDALHRRVGMSHTPVTMT